MTIPLVMDDMEHGIEPLLSSEPRGDSALDQANLVSAAACVGRHAATTVLDEAIREAEAFLAALRDG